MRLFHYTNGAALLNIIKHQKLWLTHINYLNDTSEFIHGLDIIGCYVNKMIDDEKIREELHLIKEKSSNLIDYYICSFSTAPDLLSQWRGYCPLNGGYAIEFDHELLIRGMGEYYSLNQCIYTEHEKQEKASTKVLNNKEKLYNSYSKYGENDHKIDFFIHALAMFSIATYFKNESFKEEAEYRLTTLETSFIQKNLMMFREKNGVLIPYIEEKFDHNAIKSVWVGPMRDQDLAEKSIEMLFKSLKNGDGDLIYKEMPKIKKSKIPYKA